MVTASDLNPFGKFNVGLGAIGSALLLFFIGVVIVGLIGLVIWFIIDRKRYKYKLPLRTMVGNVSTRVATYKARNFPIGRAGDSLWYVKGVKKFIAPATMQDAPNEFPHWQREDGEWINHGFEDLNEKQKLMGVKFIHQDMRSQRIATATILENRLINKGFWEKYKDMIVHLIFYFIVAMLMIVTFWQWGKIVEKIGALVSTLNAMLTRYEALENPDSLIPAFAMFLTLKYKVWRNSKEWHL